MNIFFFMFFSIIYFQSYAAPTSLTYQGRIVKSDGTPLEYNNVSFIFQITDPTGQCVIYQEQVNGINMANSGGVFDVPIGSNSIQYPLGGTATILDVFNNSSSYVCGSCSSSNGNYSCSNGTGSYSASTNDIRKLRVSFYDGSGWKLISPDNIIRSVPFAGYALSAQKLGTNVAADFLLKAGLPTCTSGTFLSYDGTSLSCAPVAGASGGTVTNVTSTNSYLTVVNGNSSPALTVNVGTTANTVAAGNDARFTDARTPTGTAGGALSGNYPNPNLMDGAVTNAKINDGAISTSKLFANPGVNRLVATDSTTGSSLSALSCANGQLLTWNIATGWQCSTQNSLAVGSATTASSATNFSGSLTGDVTGTQGATVVDKIKGISLDFSVAPTNGQVLKYNGTSWIPAADNNAGGTVTSVSGTAPISVATGTSTPVISISQATTSTNGYLSSVDWNTFNNKQSSLGYIPLNPANNLSDVASVATSRNNLGLGTAAVKNVPAVGNAATTEVVLGNDSRLSDSRTPTGSAGGDITGTYPNPSLTTTGVTAGTYPKVTVDVKGRVTLGANLSATDIPNLDWSKITSGKPTTLSGYGITDSLVANGGNTGSISGGLDNAKPVSPATGDLFIATDVKRIYRYNGTAWDQLADASSTGGITALTGDVSATGPGSVAATVNLVGGKTSTAIASSVNDTVAASSNNTNSTIIKRDASGNFAASNATLSSVVIKDGQATPNTVTLQSPATVSSNYVLKFPNAQGSSNQLMINDGSGNLSWTTLSSLGGVTSVTAAGTAGNPISIGGTATAPTVDIAKATSSTNGYLSSADWTTFNNKQSASLADAKIWVGQTGTPTAVTPSGDVTMTNAAAFTITGIRGKTVSTTAPSSAGQVLRYDGTSTYVPSFLGLADIRATITPFGGAFASAACTSSQTLYWQSSTDTFQCQAVAIGDSQITYASKTANTFLAAPNGSAGAPTFRTIASADIPSISSGLTGTLPVANGGTGTTTGSITGTGGLTFAAGGTNQNVTLTPSGTGYTVLNGNVGIGTTTPAYILSVYNLSAATKSNIESGGAGTAALSRYAGLTSGSVARSYIVGMNISDSNGSYEVYDQTGAGASRLYINSAGNVGIGTTAPSFKLDVSGGNIGLFNGALDGSTYQRTVIYSDDTSGLRLEAPKNASSAQLPIQLGWRGGATGLYINGSGNVGIGTASPAGKLHVNGGGWFSGQGSPYTGGGTGTTIQYSGLGYGEIFSYDYGASVSKNLVLQQPGGYVGIGIAPAAPLHVYRDVDDIVEIQNSQRVWGFGIGKASQAGQFFIADYTAGRRVLNIDTSDNMVIYGCLVYNGGTSGTCASDRRLKKDIRPFTFGLDKILGIQPAFYKYNGLGGIEEDKKDRLGVIAQEVEKVAPEVVETTKVKLHPGDKEDTEIKVVNYNSFTYMLINAVKELYSKWSEDHQDLETHGREIASLKEENAELKARANTADARANKVEKENAEIKARLEKLEKLLNK